MSKIETRYCDLCAHCTYDVVPIEGTDYSKDIMICTKGHKPRFYQPKDPMSSDYGYKRKCEDYKEGYPPCTF